MHARFPGVVHCMRAPSCMWSASEPAEPLLSFLALSASHPELTPFWVTTRLRKYLNSSLDLSPSVLSWSPENSHETADLQNLEAQKLSALVTPSPSTS